MIKQTIPNVVVIHCKIIRSHVSIEPTKGHQQRRPFDVAMLAWVNSIMLWPILKDICFKILVQSCRLQIHDIIHILRTNICYTIKCITLIKQQ